MSVQLVVSMDDGETKLDYLIASSAKTNLRDQKVLKWPAEDYEEFVGRRAVRLILAHVRSKPAKLLSYHNSLRDWSKKS